MRDLARGLDFRRKAHSGRAAGQRPVPRCQPDEHVLERDLLHPGLGSDATSYQLFVASFGSQILQDNSAANTVAGLKGAMDLSATLPIGTIILPFFDDTDPNNTGWVAVANSGTLWVDASSVPPPPPRRRRRCRPR
jgi:hypothetical protein